METSALREKLHALIDNSQADRLEEVYHLLNEEEYPESLKKELDEEFSSYQKNGESISRKEVDKMVEQLLHGKND